MLYKFFIYFSVTPIYSYKEVQVSPLEWLLVIGFVLDRLDQLINNIYFCFVISLTALQDRASR